MENMNTSFYQHLSLVSAAAKLIGREREYVLPYQDEFDDTILVVGS